MEYHEYFGNYDDNVVLCEFCDKYSTEPCESREEAKECYFYDDSNDG